MLPSKHDQAGRNTKFSVYLRSTFDNGLFIARTTPLRSINQFPLLHKYFSHSLQAEKLFSSEIKWLQENTQKSKRMT